jgi:uncharacterized protein YndB with AHSA1/START domain
MTTPSINLEGNTADRELVVSRVFDAPRELVWEAMANPAHVVNWWGPVGFTTTTEKMDLRPGGEWKHVMHGPDGANYPNHSTFLEVVKPERIVYEHGGKREGGPSVHFLMTWTFEALGENQTRLTLRQVYENKEARDLIVKEYGAGEGAKQTLARLAEFLDPDTVIIERSFDAPIDAVWRAITEPEQMKKWYFPGIETFKAEVGFEVRVNSEYEGKVKAHVWTVTEVVPGRKISYQWNYPEKKGNSTVSWELFDEGKSTRLRLVHVGLQSFEPAKNPQYARGNFFGGWTYFAGRLKEYVEKAA